MDLSEDLAQLEQGLREAGPSGRQLRYYLLRHFCELVQLLTCSLESDVQPDPHADANKQPQAATSMQPEGGMLETVSGRSGDPVGDAYQREVRNQAREVFDERSLEGEDYVALWMDAVPVWGRSLVLCMGVTAGGYRHMLGCIEATLQHDAAIRQLLQGLSKRGLCANRGLLCITRGQSWLTRVLEEVLGPHLFHQHCQMAKRERVVSYLAEKQQRRVRGAITRAFQLPDRGEAHAALMRIHAELEVAQSVCGPVAATGPGADADPAPDGHVRAAVFESQEHALPGSHGVPRRPADSSGGPSSRSSSRPAGTRP